MAERRAWLLGALVALLLAVTAAEAAARPLVIAHRGASGYRPEHTLAAYALGARQGADYIEPDVVATRDGVLVVRHENEISTTTDVASHREFAGRRTTKTIDGVPVTGWFTEDFTLAELRTLRAIERLPGLRPRSAAYDGRYRIPTLQEVIDLSRRLSRRLDRKIGLYPETKHPTYFRSIGLSLERRLLVVLRRNGLYRRRAHVFIQSFEADSLRRLNRATRLRLVQLLGTPQPPTGPAELRAFARYADAIGPEKGTLTRGLVRRAHRAGLLVHPYTFRRENAFLPLELWSGTDPAAYGRIGVEFERAFDLGVDGVFTDHPDTAVRARRRAQ